MSLPPLPGTMLVFMREAEHQEIQHWSYGGGGGAQIRPWECILEQTYVVNLQRESTFMSKIVGGCQWVGCRVDLRMESVVKSSVYWIEMNCMFNLI